MGYAEPKLDEGRLGSRVAERVRTGSVIEARYHGEEILTWVLDFSLTGLRLETRQTRMQPGQSLTVRLPLMEEREARVVWAKDFIAGCQFATAIDPVHAQVIARSLQPATAPS